MILLSLNKLVCMSVCLYCTQDEFLILSMEHEKFRSSPQLAECERNASGTVVDNHSLPSRKGSNIQKTFHGSGPEPHSNHTFCPSLTGNKFH